MQRHLPRPPDLIEIILLVSIAVILGFAIAPQVHMYLYHKKAAQIADAYMDTVGRLLIDVRSSPTGSRVYVLTGDGRSGFFSNKRGTFDGREYLIGDDPSNNGSIYFSHPYFTIGYENRFIHNYFLPDPDMQLIFPNTAAGYARKSDTILCRGHRVIEKVSMNFDVPKYNRRVKYKVERILKNHGYDVNNFIVSEHINSAGDLCK